MSYDTKLFGLPTPYLEITRQPKKYGYRFRYGSEGVAHGGIPGSSSNNVADKAFPSIKLHNLNGRKAKVILRLAAEHDGLMMHIHSLIVQREVKGGVYMMILDEINDTMEFTNIAIQQYKERHKGDLLDYQEKVLQSRYLHAVYQNNLTLDADSFMDSLHDQPYGTLIDRLSNNELSATDFDLLQEAAKLKKEMKLHTVRLAFHVFLQDDEDRFTNMLPVVYSDLIIDGKTKEGCGYSILRMSAKSGRAEGNDEVWLLCNKINPDDLQVRLYSMPSALVPWEGFGKFNAKSDVDSQRLVIFRTPEYTLPVNGSEDVYLEVRAISDPLRCSSPMTFTYIFDEYIVGKKRKRVPPPPKDTQLDLQQFANIDNDMTNFLASFAHTKDSQENLQQQSSNIVPGEGTENCLDEILKQDINDVFHNQFADVILSSSAEAAVNTTPATSFACPINGDQANLRVTDRILNDSNLDTQTADESTGTDLTFS